MTSPKSSRFSAATFNWVALSRSSCPSFSATARAASPASRSEQTQNLSESVRNMAESSHKQVGFLRQNRTFDGQERGAALLPFQALGAMRDLAGGRAVERQNGMTFGTCGRHAAAKLSGGSFDISTTLCARGATLW